MRMFGCHPHNCLIACDLKSARSVIYNGSWGLEAAQLAEPDKLSSLSTRGIVHPRTSHRFPAHH
jgi:hypothetical protein